MKPSLLPFTIASLLLCGCHGAVDSNNPDSGTAADASLDTSTEASIDASGDASGDGASPDAPFDAGSADAAADTTPDAEAGPTVACGSVRCDSSKVGAIRGCAVGPSGHECNNAGCYDHGDCNFILQCATAADCPNGNVCCFGTMFRTYSDCYTSCPSGTIQLCEAPAECTNGAACEPVACGDIKIGTCGTPDGGNTPRCK